MSALCCSSKAWRIGGPQGALWFGHSLVKSGQLQWQGKNGGRPIRNLPTTYYPRPMFKLVDIDRLRTLDCAEQFLRGIPDARLGEPMALVENPRLRRRWLAIALPIYQFPRVRAPARVS